MRTTAPRILALASACPVPHVDHCLDVLLGDCGDTDNEAFERLVELEVHLFCALQLHNEDRVVVRLDMFVSLVLLVWVLVREVDVLMYRRNLFACRKAGCSSKRLSTLRVCLFLGWMKAIHYSSTRTHALTR